MYFKCNFLSIFLIELVSVNTLFFSTEKRNQEILLWASNKEKALRHLFCRTSHVLFFFHSLSLIQTFVIYFYFSCLCFKSVILDVELKLDSYHVPEFAVWVLLPVSVEWELFQSPVGEWERAVNAFSVVPFFFFSCFFFQTFVLIPLLIVRSSLSLTLCGCMDFFLNFM